MTHYVLKRLTKKGLPSALFIAVAFGIAAFVHYADDIPGTSGIIQLAPGLFGHNFLFSFVIIFVAYMAWVWGLGGAALVLSAHLALLGFHILSEWFTAERGLLTGHVVITVVGAGVAVVAFARWGKEYRLV